MPKATTTYPSEVVEGKRHSNGGWHSKGRRAYRQAERTIINCLQYYREPRLYHVVFAGGTHIGHLGMRQALCQRLTRKKLPHEWFSARERCDTKGEHLHVFFLVDSDETMAQSVLNTYADCWLALECGKRGLSKPWINGPQGEDLHGGSHHATLPYLGPKNRVTELGIDRLVDALSWLTYIYKARDKHDEEWKGQGQIFAASRPTRSKQVAILADERQQADSGLVIKVKTGDDLLHKMIAETQRRYWPLCAAVGAALH